MGIQKAERKVENKENESSFSKGARASCKRFFLPISLKSSASGQRLHLPSTFTEMSRPLAFPVLQGRSSQAPKMKSG